MGSTHVTMITGNITHAINISSTPAPQYLKVVIFDITINDESSPIDLLLRNEHSQRSVLPRLVLDCDKSIQQITISYDSVPSFVVRWPY